VLAGRSAGSRWPMRLAATASGWRAGGIEAYVIHSASVAVSLIVSHSLPAGLRRSGETSGWGKLNSRFGRSGAVAPPTFGANPCHSINRERATAFRSAGAQLLVGLRGATVPVSS
jgi:hypothetical protein